MNTRSMNHEHNGLTVTENVAVSRDGAYPQQEVVPSGFSRPSVFIIIPAYNEGPVIQDILQKVVSNRDILELGGQVVVVDDGSNDDTWKNVANLASSSEPNRKAPPTEKRLPIHLLHHIVNLGQGAALATGIQYALAEGAQIVVTFDADGQHLAEDIPFLVAPIAAGLADVALGSRFLPGVASVKEAAVGSSREDRLSAYNIPGPRRMLLKIAIIFTGLTEKIWLSDVHNGLRAFSARAASQIKITQNRMAHASEIIHEIARLKLRYVEIPVHVCYTEYSRMKGQRASDALNVIIEILEVLFSGEEQKP